MSRRNGLGIDLMQSLLDLCGIHLHRTTPLVWVSVRGRTSCGPPTPSAHNQRFIGSSACSPPLILGQLLMRSTRGSGSSCDKTIGSRNRASPKSHAEPRHCSLVHSPCDVAPP